MEPLQHDPRTKQQIKDALYGFIYKPVERHLKSRLDTLIVRNALATGTGHMSFHYKGEYYCCDTHPAPRKWNRLATQLRPAMNEYLDDLKALNEGELPYVLGFFNQVLNSSNDFEDYLRLLPESIHHPLQKLQASCPCRAAQLPEARVNELLVQNQIPITLIKRRMVTNLLI